MEYHLHCDLAAVPDELAAYLQAVGFYPDNFLGSNDWGISYEPNQHFTHKFGDGQGALLNEACKDLSRWIDAHRDKFIGYWEAEVVTEQVRFQAVAPFDATIPRPFSLARMPTPIGYFKEKETHISFSKDDSDLRLGRALLAMGLYPVWWQDPISGAVEEIWTIAGSSAAIDRITPYLQAYLAAAGGAHNLVMEVEVVAGWQANPPNFQLPPLIGSIEAAR